MNDKPTVHIMKNYLAIQRNGVLINTFVINHKRQYIVLFYLHIILCYFIYMYARNKEINRIRKLISGCKIAFPDSSLVG